MLKKENKKLNSPPDPDGLLRVKLSLFSNFSSAGLETIDFISILFVVTHELKKK